MRTVWLLSLAAILSLGWCGRVSASEGFDDIAKLAKSGIGEEVLVAYVQASPVAYELSVEEILYLNDVGVSKDAIQAILNHGKDMRAGKAPIVADDADLKPLDTTPGVITDPNDPNLADDPALIPAGGDPALADPNIPAEAPVYVSPLTGNTSSTPELFQETEVVRETVSMPAPVEACAECTVSHFYEALTPYGTWINVNNTWCWQPSVCAGDPGWRPYCHRGHWVWSDSGWCWESDYSWGWAPFHYGRWYRADGYGWLWAPDTTWGPAWVNWRQSDSHWGWAPLPPAARFETDAAVGVGFHFGGKHWGVDLGVGVDFGLRQHDYCFVQRERFCDTGLHLHIAPVTQQFAIYKQTTIIQNNITIVNRNVYVHGPRSELVAQFTHRDLRPVRIADAEIRVGATLTKGHFEADGVLRFYRPRVSRVAAESPSEIAARQVARVAINTKPTADPRVLAAQVRADELRERHFATQDARRQEVLLKQSERIEEAAAKRSDIEQLRLNRAMANTDSAEQKAAFAAKLTEERKLAEQARLQKESIQKQAAEQRKLTAQLAHERDRVARAGTTTESVKAAADTRTRLAAERAEREKAQREASLQAEASRKDQLARATEARANAKNNVEAKQAADVAERKAKLDAERAAREATTKAQADIAAKQRAQLEADRIARQNAARNKQPAADPAPRSRIPATDPNAGADTAKAARDAAENDRKAKLEADRIARQKAAQDAAAARDAAGDDRKAKLEADRIARQKAAQDAAAKDAAQDNDRKAKMEAERIARQKALQDAAAARDAAGDERKAKLEADRIARQKAAQEAETERKAKLDAARETRPNRNNPAATQPVNPQTGQPYNPNDPNDPNNPVNTRKRK